MKKLLLLNLFLLSGTAMVAQTAYEELDINDVRTGILNCGDLNWNLVNGVYEVPKGSGRNAVFSSALWMGGIDNGSALHQAAMTYRQSGLDYWPGPLDTLTGATDLATSTAYDKIWKLNRSEIDEFRAMYANGSVTAGTYTPAYNILNWPAQGTGTYTRNMAPFVDVNGDGLYNPVADGDYPKIKGDQMCYWIFNDNLDVHHESGGIPLKAEIHGSAYAYACDSISTIDSLNSINYTTFYSFEIYNRSTADYHNTYIGLWQDMEIGSYADDYAGSNPSENYAFGYNADSVDESPAGGLGYGANPPMLSTVVLNGPEAVAGDGIDNNNNGTTDEPGEKNLLTNVLFSANNNHPVNGNPSGTDFYDYMRSIWKDGSHLNYGGNGIGTGAPYNFMYDGLLDGTPWSQISEGSFPTDTRAVMGCGPFNLNAGQHVSFGYAMVYTRDNQPAYNVVSLYNKNLDDVRRIKQWYANDNFPSCNPIATGINDLQPAESAFMLYPNPSANVITISYQSAQANDATVEMYTVQGQLLKQIKMNGTSKLSVNIEELPAGLYILKVTDNGKVTAKKFLKR